MRRDGYRADVYIAGPYTQGDVAQNVAVAMTVGNSLLSAGFAVYVPHLSHFLHMQRGRDYEEWIRHDLHWLFFCDAMLRLPGPSVGADREMAYAKECEMPIFHDVESLLTHFPERTS